MVTNDMLAMAVSPFYLEDDVKASTLMCPIPTEEEFTSHNTIKVVVDVNNNALYFSREPIPSPAKGIVGIPPLKVISVASFDAQFLLEFREMPATTLELIEDIPILRALEYGFKVKMIMSDKYTMSVDTPQDLEKVRKLMENDPLIKRYLTSLN
jgi:3-deoxy-manno-octulosonate cytidylyltransferase (CMP-KDO synthetase)